MKAIPGLHALHIRYHRARLRSQARSLSRRVRAYHSGTRDPEIHEVLAALEHGPVRMIPYAYVADYFAREIPVGREGELPFAALGDARVYFPRHYSPADVRFSVAEALSEQDERSPHRYLHDGMALGRDDAAVLIGASDGMFALRIAPGVRRIWVFEPDPKWAEPLERTLAPWRDRVEIVQAWVGGSPARATVSLDAFFAERGDAPTFIQADVEGSELDVLQGAKQLIEASPRMALSICTYHRQEDYDVISRELRAMGFHVSPSRGYVLVHSQLLRPPYLRRAVAYASKAR